METLSYTARTRAIKQKGKVMYHYIAIPADICRALEIEHLSLLQVIVGNTGKKEPQRQFKTPPGPKSAKTKEVQSGPQKHIQNSPPKAEFKTASSMVGIDYPDPEEELSDRELEAYQEYIKNPSRDIINRINKEFSASTAQNIIKFGNRTIKAQSNSGVSHKQ